MIISIPHIIIIIIGVLFTIFVGWLAFSDEGLEAMGIMVIACIAGILMLCCDYADHNLHIKEQTKCGCMCCDLFSNESAVKDNYWTCCEEERKSNFCPECGKQRIIN